MENAIYFHGFNSEPDYNNPKVKLLEKLGLEAHLIDARPGFLPSDYEASARKLVTGTMAPDNTVFVGTSLGGYWARELAYKMGKFPFVAINPVINPFTTLTSLGHPINEYRGLGVSSAPGLEGLVILSSGDPVINSNETYCTFRDKHWVMVVDSGDHRALELHKYSSTLAKFISMAGTY